MKGVHLINAFIGVFLGIAGLLCGYRIAAVLIIAGMWSVTNALLVSRRGRGEH